MGRRMKWMKQCPAVILLIGTGIVLTIFGFVGKNTAYAQSEYNGLKMPLLSLVFMGINEEVYPWQIFQGGQSVQAATSDDATLQADAGDVAGDSGGDVQDTEGTDAVGPAASASPQVTPSPTPAATPGAALHHGAGPHRSAGWACPALSRM